jgi:hypothetical protein
MMKGTDVVNRLKVESKNSTKNILSTPSELILQKETMHIFGQTKSLYKVSIKDNVYEVGWVLNDQTPSCLRCNINFGLFNWRHHCRECGYIICGSCGSNKTVVLALKSSNSRVCNICFEKSSQESSKVPQLPSLCESFDGKSHSNIHKEIIREIVNNSNQLPQDYSDTNEQNLSPTEDINCESSVTLPPASSVTFEPIDSQQITIVDTDESSKSILGLHLVDGCSVDQGSMEFSDDSGDEEGQQRAQSTTPTEGGPRIVSYRGEGDNWQTVYQQQLKEEAEEEEQESGSTQNETPHASQNHSASHEGGDTTDSDSSKSDTNNTIVDVHATTLANLTPVTSRRILETALHNGGVWEADSDCDSLASVTPRSTAGGHLADHSVTPVVVGRPMDKRSVSVTGRSVFADIIDTV